jgi:hypothetical protein
MQPEVTRLELKPTAPQHIYSALHNGNRPRVGVKVMRYFEGAALAVVALSAQALVIGSLFIS